MNRDPYGRGDNADADPYFVRRPVADCPGRPSPSLQPGREPDHGQYYDPVSGPYGLDPHGYDYVIGAYGHEPDTGWQGSGAPGVGYGGSAQEPDGYHPGGGYYDGYPPGDLPGYPPGDRFGDLFGDPMSGAYPGPDHQAGAYPGEGYPGQGYPGQAYPGQAHGRDGRAGRDGAQYHPYGGVRGPDQAGGHAHVDRGGHDRVRTGPRSGRADSNRRRSPLDVEQRKRSIRPAMPLWQELPLLLVVAFCLAVLIRTFLLQAFYIPSGSMENTLLIGDRVLVNKIVYDVREPTRGEVVVFRGTDNWDPENVAQQKGSFVGRLGKTIGDLIGVSEPGERDFIKRVIGLPGDTVACCDAQGRVTVNGYPLDEPYVTDNSSVDIAPSPRECRSRRFGPIVIEQGQMFVMGDHRAVSQDSRCQGPVPIKNVIGRAFVIVWPSDQWAGLPVPETFSKVPRPLAAAGRSGAPPGDTPATRRTVAAAQRPVVWHQIGLFIPFVWLLSPRRVRPTRTRSDNVGSSL